VVEVERDIEEKILTRPEGLQGNTGKVAWVDGKDRDFLFAQGEEFGRCRA